MTLRDNVWDEILKRMFEDGPFKISDLPFDEGTRHTVRRVLMEMENLGWVAREGKRSAVWYPGEQFFLHLGFTREDWDHDLPWD